MDGKRIFLCYTGEELPAILPFNHGQPVPGGSWFTLIGVVTGEIPQGVWLRLECIWNGETKNAQPEPFDEYFIAWGNFRRAIMARDQPPAPADHRPLPGLYL